MLSDVKLVIQKNVKSFLNNIPTKGKMQNPRTTILIPHAKTFMSARRQKFQAHPRLVTLSLKRDNRKGLNLQKI